MDDIQRLRDVGKRYNARDVVLAEWVKESHLSFYKLGRHYRDLERAWEEVDLGILFARREKPFSIALGSGKF